MGIPIIYWDDGGNYSIMKQKSAQWDTTYNSDQLASTLLENYRTVSEEIANNNPDTPKDTIASKKTAVGKEVKAISENSVTELKDDFGNIVKIPKGFGIASDSETKVTKGIVIEDALHEGTTKGSQFVWIPVGNIYTDKNKTEATITLGRYSFNSETGKEDLKQEASITGYTDKKQIGGFYEYDASNIDYENIKARNLSQFIKSAIDNKGYYIARFEAGIKGTNSSNQNDTQNELTKNSTTTGYIVSKKGVAVWNRITEANAAQVCQNMYDNATENITSDLINSYAWDTAIVFIQEFGTDGNYSKYSREKYFQKALTTTGNSSNGTRYDKQCNIYDMAGNVAEWTTETSSRTTEDANYPCTYRGGRNGLEDYYTSTRISTKTIDLYNSVRI